MKPPKIDKNAFNPAHSVFVSANAGSGKTRLLVTRVLSLLMHGVPPSKIVCLTFTNSAAAEMSSRIKKILGSWVMMEDANLKLKLEEFMNPPFSEAILKRARGLLASVLDAEIGLRLQTIHGFCQSILARFPLEAQVGTNLSIIDEATQLLLLKEARMQLFSGSFASRDDLYHLAQQLGENSLLSLLAEMIKNKRDLARFIESQGVNFNREICRRKIYRAFGAYEQQELHDFIYREIQRDTEHLQNLRLIAEILQESDKERNKTTAESLFKWCLLENNKAHYELYNYFDSFCIKSGENKGNKRLLFTKNILTAAQENFLLAEQEKAIACLDAINANRDAEFTFRLVSISSSLLEIYNNLKNQNGFMDFDDQIESAARLLSTSKINSWIMYKLDGGIDHVLVDEAQDTSPEQWQIVRAITAEFFAGKGRAEQARSLFVVGDEKQSIFRFQGADPIGLFENRKYFSALIKEAALPVHNIALTHSYRSAPEILKLVDTIFSNSNARDGLCAENENINIEKENVENNNAIIHQAIRDNVAGYCEYWPLVKADKELHLSSNYLLATQIANWLEEKIKNGLSPADVMILVRRRNSFVASITKALKRKNIPVAGIDRMRLMDNIVVQDLLAFAQILLFPQDDLTLASLLKSPIFSFTEEELFSLCNERNSSLWQAISDKKSQNEKFAKAFSLISEFQNKVDILSPYALFVELLDIRLTRRLFVGRLGAETQEIIDIFLEQALSFEKSNIISMQAFIAWLQEGDSELKRDMDNAANCVRIMTIHAAKGLQAKMVIIADSTTTPFMHDKILWQKDKDGEDKDGENNNKNKIPLATSAGTFTSKAILNRKEQEIKLQMQEYRRLLYVALTRAEDMLIICGAEYGKSKIGFQENSWYALVEPAFSALGIKKDDGKITIGNDPYAQNAQIISDNKPQENAENNLISYPLFIDDSPNINEITEKTLSPSNMEDNESDYNAASPLLNNKLRQRGIALHRIIQHAPNAKSKTARLAIAQKIVLTDAYDLDKNEQQSLIDEALAVIEHPDYADLFSTKSIAEVPVSGKILWKGKYLPVTGRIDRLAITDNQVLIVDYKSSISPPPAGKIPLRYREQMEIYKLLIAEIYPQHKIRAGILWTANLRLDWIF